MGLMHPIASVRHESPPRQLSGSVGRYPQPILAIKAQGWVGKAGDSDRRIRVVQRGDFWVGQGYRMHKPYPPGVS